MHPSGDMCPSKADYEITSKLAKCCDIMEIELIDHIVFDDNQLFSINSQKTILRNNNHVMETYSNFIQNKGREI